MTMTRSTVAVLVLLLGLLLPACGSAEPSPQPPYAPRAVVELARWQVFDGEAPVGWVKHMEIRDPAGPLAYYRIEDAAGRWLGHATPGLRFSRRVPFQDQEQDLGVWSLPRGAGELLGAKGTVQLKPVALEAGAKKR